MNTEKNNTGFLFRNKRKEKETHKDYEGHCNIEGVQYWMSGWVRMGKDEEKYLSVAFEEKKENIL